MACNPWLPTLYVSPKDSVLPVEDRAIAFPSVCFCVVFIKIQNTAFWQHCISGECAFSKLTKPLHLHMYREKDSVSVFPSHIVPTKHIVCCVCHLAEESYASILSDRQSFTVGL